MRITKKVVSLVLAILMVTTMMSVMAVSASALDVTVVNLSDLTESYVIIEGGNYQFTGVSTLAKPVIINTTEAVTIQDSTIVTTKTGDTGYAVTVIAADSNVTIKDSTLKSYARAIEYDFDVTPQTGTLTVDNTTMVTYGLEEENYTTTLVNGGSATKRAVNFGKVNINATFTGSTFAGYHYAINFTQQAAGANSTVTATNCKFYARAALNNWAPNLTATFNSCTVYAINNFGGSSESFAAFVVYDGADNTKVYLNGTEVIASYNGAGVTNANAVNNLLDVRGNNCTIKANDSSYTDTTNKGSIVSEDNVLEYLLDGDTNTVIINGGTYDCNFPETYDASAYAAYISDPDIDASNVSITQFYANVIEVQDGTFTDEVPVEFLGNTVDVTDNGDGTYTVEPSGKTYVARVGDDRYETVKDAFLAAPANSTVVLLTDLDYGVKLSGTDLFYTVKSGLTFDLNQKTITDASQYAIDVKLYNSLTIKNGTVVTTATHSGSYATNCAICVGSTVVLDNLNIVAEQSGRFGVYLNGSSANATIKNTIIRTTSDCVYSDEANNTVLLGGNDFYSSERNAINIKIYNTMYDYVTIDGGTYKGSRYSVYTESKNGDRGEKIVTINGGTFESETEAALRMYSDMYMSNDISHFALNINGGEFISPNGITSIESVKSSYQGTVRITNFISGGTFKVRNKDHSDLTDFLADGCNYVNLDNNFVKVGTGMLNATVTFDSKLFGFDNDTFTDYEILGSQESVDGSAVRFVTAVNEGFLKSANIEDYGYVLAKASGLTQDGIGDKFSALQYNGGNGEHTVSCKGSSNTLSGDYGKYSTSTKYKYVTAEVTNMSGSDQAVARFYIKTKDGNVYYANYNNGTSYSGLIAGLS